MPRYRKKPVIIEAFQLPPLDRDPTPELIDFLHQSENITSDFDGGVSIITKEGIMRGDPEDWIIKGVAGEFYPCKPEIFTETYEAVKED